MKTTMFAAVALVVVALSAGGAQAQTTDKHVVRCVEEYSPGMANRNMTCSTRQNTFTKVPAGKHFSITEVTLVPFSAAPEAITGVALQKVLENALFDLFYLRQIGGNSVTHNWRASPLVLNGGTSLQLSTFHDTNTAGQIVVTGILAPDTNASVR
jgi:hypothetical protein